MGWPQYTWLALVFLGLGIGLAKHGEPRKSHNFWSDLGCALIAFGLLCAGGFFG